MSRVDILVEARGSLSVKFMEFTRVISKGKYAVFFEGEDEKYYSVRINTISPGVRWTGIVSGGKSNVINLRAMIRRHTTYCNSQCIFFVDADFDDNASVENYEDVYITPCYSVENFYLSDEAFCRILNAEYGINDSQESLVSYNNSLEFFKLTKNLYLNAIMPFNCLIRELRIMEEKGSLEGRLNINNIKFEDLVRVGLGEVEKIYDEKKPKCVFSELSETMTIDISESKRYFNNINGELWFRGKQNLEFLRVFLGRLKEDCGKKESRTVFENKASIKLQLTKGNCMSELSQYADTPHCLKSFLELRLAG
ncbi:DUF4435 domain-containing protein [Vreelandella glaciei]|uniref:DUF4435 domain-containing protein n=1 Tax=Vreelandella glaciei TaxID=186761 RepID=UPI003001602A